MHLSAIYRELVAVHASSDDERATLAVECLLLIDCIIPEPELLLKMIATCDPPHPQVRCILYKDWTMRLKGKF